MTRHVITAHAVNISSLLRISVNYYSRFIYIYLSDHGPSNIAVSHCQSITTTLFVSGSFQIAQ